MNGLKDLFNGIGFLVEGMRILRSHPSLLAFAIVPLILDIIGFVLGVYFGSAVLSSWVAWALGLIITPAAGVWYSLLYYPILVLLWLAFLVVLGYLIFLIGSVIAGPFHSLLAERTLMKLGALQTQPFKLWPWLKTTFRMFLVSLVKLFVFAILGLVIFVTSFVPGINILGSFFACLIVAFDTMDYSFELKGWDLKHRFRFFKAELPLFSGMALVIGLTLLVPGLTLLFYPAAVVGASSRLAQSRRLQKGI